MKKRIRYSELATPPVEGPGDPGSQAAAPPTRARAPLDLARALAAARATEAAQASAATTSAAAAPAIGREVVGRLTPMRGSRAIGRPTPIRGSLSIVAPAPAALAPNIAPTGMPALRDRARSRAGRVEVLAFSVGGEWFGVELAAVEEAIDLPDVRHIPEMTPAMLGVITVRGALTSVYSPVTALGLAPRTAGSALIFRRTRGRIGIAVDDVDDVHSLDLAQLRDAPGADATDGTVLGVLRYRNTLLALVDADALIAACQTAPVMEIA